MSRGNTNQAEFEVTNVNSLYLAQLVDHRPQNQKIAGSIPGTGKYVGKS